MIRSTKKSPQTKRSRGVVNQPSGSSINPLHTKSQVMESIEAIFCSKISTNVLVDMAIDNSNYFITLGRPQGYYGNKQERHIIPYSFIVNAIKSIVMNKKVGYKQYLESILKSTSSLIYKSGICLTEEQFAKLPEQYKTFPNQFQLKTYTKKNDAVNNTYHMIYNTMIISTLTNIPGFTNDIKQHAEDEFQNKFSKYVQFGIKKYLELRVNSDEEYAMTAFLEAITRMILSVSNQDRNSAFPTEGNSICAEVRLYPDTQSALNAGDDYTLCSQAMITKIITEECDVNKYNKCIRIVNNEGARVQKASSALTQLNTFMDTEIFEKVHDTRHSRTVKKLKPMQKEEYLQELYTKYNNSHTANKYNDLYASTNSLDINQYYKEPLNPNNIKDLFHYHVAMYLYSIFDFKPLENNVLVPQIQQPNENNLVQVYPCAKGKRMVSYVVKNGDLYRETQCNTVTGYDEPRFRSELEDTEILNILKDKIVTYITVALVPFAGLRNGFKNNDDDELSGTALIMKAFCELIQQEYKLDGKLKLEPEYLEKIKTNLLNLSGQSSVLEQDNFDL